MLGTRAPRLALAALAALLVTPALGAGAARAGKHGLTVDDMLAMQRVESPAVSPDGKLVAFSVRDTDVEANRGRFDIWVAAVDGSSTRPLTRDPENDTSPAWSPDGSAVLFLSTRSGTSQVWRIPVGGGEAEQLTRLPVDVNGFLPFPDGKRLVLAIDVWPNARSIKASVARDTQQASSKVKAHIYDQLLFRHWDGWEDGKYSHLFVWTPPSLGGKADDARDLTPGQLTDSPTHPFGGMEEVSVAPGGKSVAFVARVGGRSIAWTTNTDVFVVPTGGGKPVNMTAANPSYDNNPAFSPDGRSLALLAMQRAGYEADRRRVVVIDLATRRRRVLTERWDRSPGSITWSADGRTIFTSADNTGNQSLFAVDVASGKPSVIVEKGNNADPRIAGGRVVFGRDTLRQPVELYSVDPSGRELRQITHLNDARVKAIAWGEYEQFSFRGARGDTVYGYAMKPAGFDGKGKVPVAFLVHGGPQGSFGDHFHYRWNAEAFAGHGFGVVFIDFHGSTGYGQAFTDAINGDWGGAPYEDLMLGLDAALARYRWLDGKRVAAAGGSFGGYMINWINGKTDRFRALVCHDGNIDERMAYYATEELWFPEWEHGGTPWAAHQTYAKHNPIDLVKNWKTPTLVIHGGNDFRVVETQGMATFTALQRKGVPSRLLHFPDENHFVLKPQNTRVWHREVLGWMDRYTGHKAR
ncbi:MAG TPA: S9 family peptidase [Kofleriaceae bacterium]|nr:S9 family peptidase [Kofleriaceae bacterium]